MKLMKRTILATFLINGLLCVAQIEGNGQIVTQSIPMENLKKLEINLYANISVDPTLKEELKITGDSNLLPFIDTELIDGVLDLTQLKWIQPSQELIIVIGAPEIEHISLGTNGTISVCNINVEKLAITATIGTVVLQGTVNTLNANAENGTIDAKSVRVQTTYLNIWGEGSAILNTDQLIVMALSPNSCLDLKKRPKKIVGSIEHALKNKPTSLKGVAYIRFKIKNNSLNRNHFYVVGPKPKGGNFSYGFPMMPGSVRKENWTTGTRIYKVNKLGIKKLLRKIRAEDEGEIVELF